MHTLFVVLSSLLLFGVVFMVGVVLLVVQILAQIGSEHLGSFNEFVEKRKSPSELEVWLPDLVVGVIAIVVTDSLVMAGVTMIMVDALLASIRVQACISAFNRRG